MCEIEEKAYKEKMLEKTRIADEYHKKYKLYWSAAVVEIIRKYPNDLPLSHLDELIKRTDELKAPEEASDV